MQFAIHNRFTGEVQFTAEIECAKDAPTSVKIGLAVKWAVKARANLARANLAGANLAGADLAGANLAGAYLAGAGLAGANLAGADLAGANLARANLAGANLAGADLAGANLAGAYLAGAGLAGAGLIDAGQNKRGNRFWAWRHADGHVVYRGGCRQWKSLEDALAHYGDDYRVPEAREESIDRLRLMHAEAGRRGWLQEAPEQAAE